MYNEIINCVFKTVLLKMKQNKLMYANLPVEQGQGVGFKIQNAILKL